jgi:signal transduction histidine kinase
VRTPRVPGLAAGRALAVDAGLTLGTIAIVEIAIVISDDQRGVSGLPAYLAGAVMALPILFWRRWPLGVLLTCSLLQILYYSAKLPGIAPSPLLAFALYAAALAGRLRWAIGVPVFFYTYGLFYVWVRQGHGFLYSFGSLLPHIALAAVTILLGELVRNRRALAEETRERLRQAAADREREAARRVAEERVRIARELHDTVAHSMATITVQAGSALHVLDGESEHVRDALHAIRDTSKSALQELRATLGLLREGGAEEYGPAGLDRLPALLDAVRAAGVPVTLEVCGRSMPLEPAADHSAYRILQESLTNVLRHAGPRARAGIRMAYDPAGLAIEVTDDGAGPGPAHEGGHGLGGMRERAEAVGGSLTAGPRPGGGFVVSARLPVSGMVNT